MFMRISNHKSLTLSCQSQIGVGSISQRAPLLPRPALSAPCRNVQAWDAASSNVATVQVEVPEQAVFLPTSLQKLVTPSAPQLHPVIELTPEEHANVLNGRDEMVVIDYYTDYCGPCKIMSGELDKMTSAFRNVRFYKLDMGKWDKEFVSKLRVRRLPTLKLFIGGQYVEELTGAKPVELRQLLAHYSAVLAATRGTHRN